VSGTGTFGNHWSLKNLQVFRGCPLTLKFSSPPKSTQNWTKNSWNPHSSEKNKVKIENREIVSIYSNFSSHFMLIQVKANKILNNK
jgi:hypothetical protein